MDDSKGFWTCGHCSCGPHSLRFDFACVFCGRRRDAYARAYDVDERQIPESSGSRKKTTKRVSGTGNLKSSVIVKRRMEGESEDLGSVVPALLRVITGIPNHCLTFSAGEDLSFFNKCKAFLGEVSGERWCWWPLRPRMRLLQEDEIRMHWRCVRGVNAGIR